METERGERKWISVGELEKAFTIDSYAPPHCRDLTEKKLTLYFENGVVIEYKFEETKLQWRTISTGNLEWIEEEYYASKVRQGIYFIDHLRHLEQATSISIVLNFNSENFIAVIGRLPTEVEVKEPLTHKAFKELELTRVKATILCGSINKLGLETPSYEVTSELISKRAEYAYSPTQRYEHVYLNERLFTWHCLSGAERGLADTDVCTQYKLEDGLYLHVWREKIIPTLGVVVIDLKSMRTVGKIMGYRNEGFTEVSNFPIGARIIKISSYVDP